MTYFKVTRRTICRGRKTLIPPSSISSGSGLPNLSDGSKVDEFYDGCCVAVGSLVVDNSAGWHVNVEVASRMAGSI
tara:strand:+ start:171 stop:398 length:228 start_codon:yes stop_codon:yes gene_type:complete